MLEMILTITIRINIQSLRVVLYYLVLPCAMIDPAYLAYPLKF